MNWDDGVNLKLMMSRF